MSNVAETSAKGILRLIAKRFEAYQDISEDWVSEAQFLSSSEGMNILARIVEKRHLAAGTYAQLLIHHDFQSRIEAKLESKWAYGFITDEWGSQTSASNNIDIAKRAILFGLVVDSKSPSHVGLANRAVLQEWKAVHATQSPAEHMAILVTELDDVYEEMSKLVEKRELLDRADFEQQYSLLSERATELEEVEARRLREANRRLESVSSEGVRAQLDHAEELLSKYGREASS